MPLVMAGFSAGGCVQDAHARRSCTELMGDLLAPSGRWEFDAATERQLAGIWSSPHLANSERIQAYYEAFVQARLRKMGPVSRAFALAATRDVIEQKSLYARLVKSTLGQRLGPHYNLVFNRISVPQKPTLQAIDLLAAFHEVDHAIMRNGNPGSTIIHIAAFKEELLMALPTPVTPMAVLRRESTAVGAQWEFMQRIPKAIREKWMTRLSGGGGGLEPLLERLAILRKSGVISRLYENEIPRLSKQYGDKKAREILIEEILVALMDSKDNSAELIEVPKSTFSELPQVSLFYQELEQAALSLADVNELSARILDVFVNSLRRADLPKEEFIRQQSQNQGYVLEQLLKDHYFGWWRKYLLVNAALVGVFAAWSENPEKSLEGITATDVKRYMSWIAAMFSDETSGERSREEHR